MFATNNSFRMLGHARRIAQIVGLMTLALIAGIAGRFYLDLQDFAQDRVVEVGASYMPYDNVAAMTRDAELVVLGRVIGEGKTHLVPQSLDRPRPFQAPAAETLPSGDSDGGALAQPGAAPPGPPC